MATDFSQGASAPEGRSFSDKENNCKRVFQQTIKHYGDFYHLCTPGEKQSVIFRAPEDYAYMMTLVAICAYAFPNLQIVTFEIMSNHIHIILCGDEAEILAFFALLKQRLKRYFAERRTTIDLTYFDCKQPIPILTLDALRNQIAYVNRNNYVVDPDQTPFSYPYGANRYYFTPAARRYSDGRFGDLPILEKRAFVHSRNIAYPDDWQLMDGYVSPASFVHFDIGEGVFRDARHYFHKVSRDIESYKEVAELLGDSVYYTDDELISALYKICRDDFKAEKPTLLTSDQKMQLARRLHFDYNADNKKIARLLKIDLYVLNELFPLRK